MKNVSQLTNFVQNKLNEYTQTTTRTADVGIVLQVGDGIARIYGLEKFNLYQRLNSFVKD